MIIVFGGAYQGKLDFVKSKYKLKEEDVFNCSNECNYIEYDKKVIYGTENFILNMIRKGKSEEEIKEYLTYEKLKDNIVIFTDMSSGIVPISRDERMLREVNGRIITNLAKSADEVYRIFCGLENKLK